MGHLGVGPRWLTRVLGQPVQSQRRAVCSCPPCKGVGWGFHSPVYSCPIGQNLVTRLHPLQAKLENVVLIWEVMGTAKMCEFYYRRKEGRVGVEFPASTLGATHTACRSPPRAFR